MNFYNPYYSFVPYSVARPGLFSTISRGLRGFNLGSLINGTQRTLGLVNQAIPVIKQMTPMMKNAKTMFRVMNEFKKTDTPKPRQPQKNTSNSKPAETSSTNYSVDSGPTFFA